MQKEPETDITKVLADPEVPANYTDDEYYWTAEVSDFQWDE